MTDSKQPQLDIKQKLNLETGKLPWSDLQTFFARGVVIIVKPKLDLIDIAVQLSDDNTQVIEQLIGRGDIVRANDDHARRWLEKQPNFWTVVVSPWVLVQEIKQ